MKYIQTYQLFEKLTFQKTPDKVIKKRWEKKRNAIKNLQDNISKLRKKVSIDMDSEDEKTMIIATIVRIIDKTGERVGNEDSRDNGHHGISNLMKKHIKVNGSDVTLNYTGKSGVKHNVTFNDSKVARNVNKIMKRGEVFITSDGLNVKSTQVNNYLEQFDITSKDLRGFKVNQLMSEKLRKMKKPETDGEIKRMFNDALREVAEKIGHTPGICRKNYLLPEIEEAWYSGKEVQKV